MRRPSRRSVSLVALTLACQVLLAAAGCSRKPPAKDTPTTTPPASAPQSAAPVSPGTLLTGKDVLGDWTTDAPGVRRKLTTADLPPPYDTKSVDNGPKLVSRAKGALPVAPAGFRVSLYAEEMVNPRMIRAAPNGDLYVVESKANRVRMLRAGKDGTYGDGTRDANAEPFVDDLDQPFGIAFYPPGDAVKWVYVANTGSVVRYPYRDGAPAKKEEREIDERPDVTDIDLGYFLPSSPHHRAYQNAVAAGGNFAIVNRLVLFEAVAEAFRKVFKADLELLYEISHNLVQAETHPDLGDVWTHRKGATRAFPGGHPALVGTPWEKDGHPVLIPGSNRDFSYILRPLPGAVRSGYSVNHGAGRRLSRGEAIRVLDQNKVNEQYRRDDILVNLDGEVPLDEASACYKSADDVVAAVVAGGLARVEYTLWPLGSLKASDAKKKGQLRDRKKVDKGRDRDRSEARRGKRS